MKAPLKITITVHGSAKDFLLAMCAYDESTPERATERALVMAVEAWSEGMTRQRIEPMFEKGFSTTTT